MSILSFLSFHVEGISLDELCPALGANAMVSRELLQLTLSGHLSLCRLHADVPKCSPIHELSDSTRKHFE